MEGFSNTPLSQSPQFTPQETNSSQVSRAKGFTQKIGLFSSKNMFRILIALLSLLVLVGVGFFVIGGGFTRATDVVPQNVVVEEVTETSAVITWQTPIETQAVVEYGTNPTSLNFFAPETEKTKDHRVEITLLSPETTYYFQIRVGDEVFDNNGAPWTFTTKARGQQDPVSTPTPLPGIADPTPEIFLPTATPTPYQVFELDPTPTQSVVQECNFTDCNQIKQNLGKGCSVKDYLECVNRQ